VAGLLRVLESPWIWFSKTLWPNKWFSESVLPESEWWTDFISTVTYWYFLNVNWTLLYMLIKVPVWLNLLLLICFSYGPWKSLKNSWIWFWQISKTMQQCIRNVKQGLHVYSSHVQFSVHLMINFSLAFLKTGMPKWSAKYVAVYTFHLYFNLLENFFPVRKFFFKQNLGQKIPHSKEV